MKLFIKDLVTSTEEIIYEKLHFFCGDLEEASKRQTMKVKVQLLLYKKSLLNKVPRVFKCPSARVPQYPSVLRVAECLKCFSDQEPKCLECFSAQVTFKCPSALVLGCSSAMSAQLLLECSLSAQVSFECSSNKKGLQQYTGNGLLNIFIYIF